MKRVLHVIRGFNNGGTEKYVMDLLRNTYKDYENILLLYEDINYYKEELDNMNIKYIIIKSPKQLGFFKSIKKVRKVIKENNIDIVYSYTYYNSSIVMLAAYLEGIKTRITHAHRSSSEQKKSLKYLLYIFINKVLISMFTNVSLACSKEAGKSLFYKKYRIINNGINIDKYKYNTSDRIKLRRDLSIPDDYTVIGMVGRLDENKNNIYFIKVIEEYIKTNTKVKLILIGDGCEKDNLIEYVKKHNLQDYIVFLGNRNDVNRLYNVFDLYVLTSINEGLPYVLIEAQANGLRCLVSENVDRESNLSGKMIFLPITDNYKLWCSEIDKNKGIRDNNRELIISKGYSLNHSVKEVIDIYEKNN